MERERQSEFLPGCLGEEQLKADERQNGSRQFRVKSVAQRDIKFSGYSGQEVIFTDRSVARADVDDPGGSTSIWSNGPGIRKVECGRSTKIYGVIYFDAQATSRRYQGELDLK